MATYTPNLKLVKPDLNDQVSPKPFNENADILDERISAIGGITGNKWEFIKSYPVSLTYTSGSSGSGMSGNTLVVSINDMSYFSPYDELIFIIKNPDLSISSGTLTSFTLNIVRANNDISFPTGSSYNIPVITTSDKNTIESYTQYPDILLNYKRFCINPSTDPNSKTYYLQDVPNDIMYSNSVGIGLYVYSRKSGASSATFTCTVEAYGRAWAFPGV